MDPASAQCKELQKKRLRKKPTTFFAPRDLKFYMALLLSSVSFRLQILFFCVNNPTAMLFFSTLDILMSDILIIFNFSSILLVYYF